MSAVARWFMHSGLNVSGYDKTSTVLTQELQREGMSIHFDDDIRNIQVKWWLEKDKR